MRKASKQLSHRKKIIRRILLAVTILVLAVTFAAVDAIYIEPRWVKVTSHVVELPGLPRELDGLKVVQLSDIHRCDYVPDEVIRSAVKKANNLSPDIVVLTGDFINQAAHHAYPCAVMLSDLKARFGTYAVLGNHDYWNDVVTVQSELRRRKIKLLVNSSTEVAPGLVLLGLDDYWVGHPDVEKTWMGVDSSKAQIFISHSPLVAKHVRDKKCLILSGHTHGGQVQLPPIPRNKLPGLRGWEYVRGWYPEGQAMMYINSGIGMIRPPVRFLCRPEVTQFTLKCSKLGKVKVR